MYILVNNCVKKCHEGMYNTRQHEILLTGKVNEGIEERIYLLNVTQLNL